MKALALSTLLVFGPLSGTSLAEYGKATLGATGTQVNHASLSVGDLELRLDTGTVTTVRVGDKAVGLFFKGHGSLQYRVQDPHQAAILAHNLHAFGAKEPAATPSGRMVEDGLAEALFYFGGAPLPAFEGPSAPSDPKAFLKHQRFFGLRQWAVPGQILAWQEANAPNRPVVLGEISNGHTRDYLFLRDEAVGSRESIVLTEVRDTPEVLDQRSIPLATHLVGSLEDPAPPYTLVKVDLDLRATGGDAAHLIVEETLVPNRPGLTLLDFAQDDGIPYRTKPEALYSQQPVKVLAVTDSDGAKLPFEQGRGTLLVNLPQALPQGREMKLRFELEGKFLARERGGQVWQLGSGPWFPLPPVRDLILAGTEHSVELPTDPRAQAYALHCLLQTRGKDVPVAPGRVLRSEPNLLETSLEAPARGFAVEGGALAVKEVTVPGSPFHFRVVRPALLGSGKADQTALWAQDLILRMEKVLGPCPYQDILIADLPAGFALTAPGTIRVDSGMSDKHYSLNHLEALGMGTAMLWTHEKMRANRPEDAWLPRALAQLAMARALDTAVAPAWEVFDRNVSAWKGYHEVIPGGVPVAYQAWMRVPNTGFMGESQDLGGYGPILLEAIRSRVGDEDFRTFVTGLLGQDPLKGTGSADLLPRLGTLAGLDWKAFLEQHLWNSEPLDPMPGLQGKRAEFAGSNQVAH